MNQSPYSKGHITPIGQACGTCTFLELGWDQLYLNFMTEFGVEGGYPRRVRMLSKDLGMATEQGKTEVHYNSEELFQIKLPLKLNLSFFQLPI